MPNIDELSIEISANSEQAIQSINRLTNSLGRLKDNLSKINANSITGFAKSVERLATVGRRTDDTTKAIDKMAKGIAKDFDIHSKEGIDAIRDSLLSMAEAAKKFYSSGKKSEFAEEYRDAGKSLGYNIKAFAQFKKEVDATAQSVRDYVSSTNKFGTVVGLGDMAKEFGENFAAMRRVLGKGFSSSVKSTQQGVQDLAEYLLELNEATGSQFDTDNVEKGFEELYETLLRAQDATYSYSEAVKAGTIRSGTLTEAVKEYSNSLDSIIKLDDSVKTNGIDALVDSLSKLQNVSVPDFSSFAHAIEVLDKANTSRVVKNLEAVKKSLSDSTEKAEEMTTALANVGNMSFDNFGNVTGFFLNTEAEVSRFASTVTDAFSNISTGLAVINNISFDNLGNATGFIVGAKTEVTALVPIVSQITALVPVIASGVEGVSSALSGVHEKLAYSSNTLREIADKIMSDFIGRMQQTSDSTSLASQMMDNFKVSAIDALDAVRQLAQQMSRFRSMPALTDAFYKDNGPIDVDWKDVTPDVSTINGAAASFGAFSKNTQKSSATVASFADRLKAMGKVSTELVASLTLLGHQIGMVSQAFGKAGDFGMKGLSMLYTPLRNVAKEYQEKLSAIGGYFKNFQKRVTSSIGTISKFWQRTMRTFTFMLVRKAITQVIKDVKDAVDSLAVFSDKIGTGFNANISSAVADFRWLANSIVGAFEPLLNVVIPILDAIVAKVVQVIQIVGQLFAALTGQGYAIQAKKNETNYAKAVGGSNKQLKEREKLLLGIDEINKLNKEPDSSSSSGGGGVDTSMWEKVPVESWASELANKIKDVLSKLFEPLKKAWDTVLPYLKLGFEHMRTELAKLGASIARDFLTVWQQPETVAVFENLLRIIGDLMMTVGNLAKKFREAWDALTDEGITRGQSMLEHLRDIIATLVEHVRNVTWYMVRWSSEIDFNPLLTSVDELLIRLNKVADFIGGVFEDLMRNVVLKYIQWMTEEGLPHLMNTLGEVVDAFDFSKLRSDLAIIEVAFEHMAEQIDTGITNAIGNVGKALAEWTNSQEFTEFMESLARIMDLVTAERVEKLFTALGLGILNVAQGLAEFISSDKFNEFIDKLVEWYDSKSAEDLADLLGKIATAIGMFKFAEFAGGGVAQFIGFITTLMNFKNITGIASSLSEAGGAISGLGTAAATAGSSGGIGGFISSLGGIITAVGPVVAVIAGVVAVISSMVLSFGGVSGLVDELKTHFDNFKETLNRVAEATGLDARIEQLKDAFGRLKDALGNLQPLWSFLFTIITGIAQVVGGALVGAFSGFVGIVSGAIDIVAGIIQAFSGLVEIVQGVLQVLFSPDEEGFNAGWANIKQGFIDIGTGIQETFGGVAEAIGGFIDGIIGAVEGFVLGVIDFFKDLKYQLIGDPIVIDMCNGIVDAFVGFIGDVIEKVGEWVGNVVGFFIDLKNQAVTKAIEFKDNVVTKFDEFKTSAAEKFNGFKDDAAEKFNNFKDTVTTTVDGWKTDIEGKFNTWKTNVETTIENFKTNAATKFDNFKSTVLTTVENWKKDASNKIDKFKENAETRFGEFATTAEKKFSEAEQAIRNKMSDAVNTVKSKLTSMKSKFENFSLKDVASNIIRGFIDGLKSAWSSVTSWASNAVSNLKSTFKSGLDINSPSKVFESFGKFTVQGFNKGLEEMSSTTAKVVDTWVASFSGMEVNLTPSMSWASNTGVQSMVLDKSQYGSSRDIQALMDGMTSMIDQQRNPTPAQTNDKDIHIVVELDGRVIYDTVVKEAMNQMRRTGKGALLAW